MNPLLATNIDVRVHVSTRRKFIWRLSFRLPLHRMRVPRWHPTRLPGGMFDYFTVLPSTFPFDLSFPRRNKINIWFPLPVSNDSLEEISPHAVSIFSNFSAPLLPFFHLTLVSRKPRSPRQRSSRLLLWNPPLRVHTDLPPSPLIQPPYHISILILPFTLPSSQQIPTPPSNNSLQDPTHKHNYHTRTTSPLSLSLSKTPHFTSANISK